jgi:hypothetical protein
LRIFGAGSIKTKLELLISELRLSGVAELLGVK